MTNLPTSLVEKKILLFFGKLCLLFFLVVSVVAACTTVPTEMLEEDAIAELRNGNEARRNGENERAIQHLNAAIESDLLRQDLLGRAYYERGLSYNELKQYSSASDDLNVSIELGTLEGGEWLDYVSNAEFRAGQIAYNRLNQPTSAGQYFLSCARKNHCGCMNVAAGAYFSGEYGVQRSISNSIEGHERVYETGVSCFFAGAFSAGTIAEIFLLGVDGFDRNLTQAIVWITRWNVLLEVLWNERIVPESNKTTYDNLVENFHGSKHRLCIMTKIARMMGEISPDPFDTCANLEHDFDPVSAKLITYMNEGAQILEFQDVILEIEDERERVWTKCYIHLYAGVFQSLQGNSKAAREHYVEAMTEENTGPCLKETIFAKHQLNRLEDVALLTQ